MEYVYKIQGIDNAGFATVEYKNESLGSITKSFFIPHDREESVIHRLIKENFPYRMFYSRLLLRTKEIPNNIAKLSGTMSVSFDDYFYDINVEVIKQSEEKNS
jgi:hypothetical protein